MKISRKLSFAAVVLLGTWNAYAQNPVISAVYTPDPAPYVHDGKVYLFADHDEDDAMYFKMKDWMLFSTEDMVNWTYLGTQVSTATFPWAAQGDRAWAQQAVERNGKWYWYLCCNTAEGGEALAVAVADKPTGPWRDAIGGPLAIGGGFIDPTVFIDDDGTPYLLWGNKGFWYGRLNEDMVSFADGYKKMPDFDDPKAFGPLQSKMDWSIGKERMMTQYEEGPWVTKRNGIYYAVYASGGVPEHMAYSTAPTIDGPWTYRGRCMDEAENSFTIHGGNISYKGHDYMFYHNGALTNGGGFRRATCIEEFSFNADGTLPMIPFTKEGVRPVGTIHPFQRVEGETMATSYGVKFDRQPGEEHVVTSIHNGDWIRLREVDFSSATAKELTCAIRNLKHPGTVDFYLDWLGGTSLATVSFATVNAETTNSEGEATPAVGTDQSVNGETIRTVTIKTPPTGKHDVFILFRGGDDELFDFDWWELIPF